MKKRKFDSGEVKFTFVPHGFQMDFEMHGVTGKPFKGSICRDFGDDVGLGAALYLLGLGDDKPTFEKLATAHMPKKRKVKSKS